jgi:hypothetical protein
MLGSGKVDQLAIETLVRDHVAAKAAAAAAPQQPQGDAEQPHEAAE